MLKTRSLCLLLQPGFPCAAYLPNNPGERLLTFTRYQFALSLSHMPAPKFALGLELLAEDCYSAISKLLIKKTLMPESSFKGCIPKPFPLGLPVAVLIFIYFKPMFL